MKSYDEIHQEIKEQFHMDSQKVENKILLIVLGIVALPFIVFWLFIRKSYEYVPDINNLSDPIQISTSGGVTMDVDDEKVYIEFLAEYDIQGRVLATRNYDDSGLGKIWNKISPRDFVLGWGPVMSKKENINKFNIDEYLANRVIWIWPKYEYNDRFVNLFNVNFYTNKNWRKNKEGDSFLTVRSNNHPIGSNGKINLLFKKVRVGDVIRLRGYLVYVHTDKGGYWGPSSLVRNDEGCEIIYVTDITWLKQKK